jgi:hypothetical protein
MLINRIDITIAAEKITVLNAAFTTIETELDFLLALDPETAKHIARMGLRNETFTRGALAAAAQNPALIPSSLDMAALDRDLVAWEQLLPFRQRAQRLYERLNDTSLVLGADLYSGALAIYKVLKAFGPAAGLGGLLQELSRRFKAKAKTENPPASVE